MQLERIPVLPRKKEMKTNVISGKTFFLKQLLKRETGTGKTIAFIRKNSTEIYKDGKLIQVMGR
jgi:hypothetical protein